MLTNNEMLDNFRRNIEIERKKKGYTQQEMADRIEMSLSSYRRMIAGDMNLTASIVIKNLYFETGLCLHELMEVNDPYLNVLKKIRKLSSEQMQFVDYIIDRELKKES